MLSKETFNRPQCMWSLSPSRTSLVAARSALPKRRSTLETAVRWCCRTWVYWGPWRSSRELRSEREGLHRTLSVDAAHEACWRGNGSQQYDVQWSLYLYCSDRHTCIHRSITPVYNRCIRINHTCIQQVHIYQSHLYTTGTHISITPVYNRYTYINHTCIQQVHRCTCCIQVWSVVICQLTLKMPEEIDFENWRILTLKVLWPWAWIGSYSIPSCITHRSLPSTYIPNFIRIGKTFCGRTDGDTDRRSSETHFIRSTHRSRPKKGRNKFLNRLVLAWNVG